MKKKSFLSGFSAKIALVAVALSSALLTGCYKDEGLDTDTPAGSVTLPDATYTLTGTIVDKDGVMIANATGTAAGQAFTGATFSVKAQPGEQTITAKAEGYKEVTKKVQILEVKPGQSAVYNEIIVLTKEEATPEYKTYDLKVAVFGADDTNTQLAADKDYSLKVTDETGNEVALTGLAAGHYNVVVTPTDADKYIATTCSVDLPKVEGEANAAYYLPVVLNLKDAEKEYQILYAEAENYAELTSMEIFKNGNVVASTTSGKLFYLAEKDGSVYKLEVKAKTWEGVQVERVFFYSDEVTSFVIDFNEKGASAVVVDGVVTSGDFVLGAEDRFSVLDGTTATLNGENFDGAIQLVRMQNYETLDVLRVYEGTPDGLLFSKPIQVSFADNWGGELGDLSLEYWGNDKWTADSNVTTSKKEYVMNVGHFSIFRARLPYSATSSYEYVTEDTEHLIDRKNDNDVSITVPYTYTYKYGMIFDVEAAVRAAGFTNDNAIAYVANLITTVMNNSGFVNFGIQSVTTTTDITVTPWTLLKKVTKTQVTYVYDVVFELAGKTVHINVIQEAGAWITPDLFEYGHGHGHGHGHGDDLNAGGGIIEGE